MKTKQQLISDLKDGSFVAEKMETKLIKKEDIIDFIKYNCSLYFNNYKINKKSKTELLLIELESSNKRDQLFTPLFVNDLIIEYLEEFKKRPEIDFVKNNKKDEIYAIMDFNLKIKEIPSIIFNYCVNYSVEDSTCEIPSHFDNYTEKCIAVDDWYNINELEEKISVIFNTVLPKIKDSIFSVPVEDIIDFSDLDKRTKFEVANDLLKIDSNSLDSSVNFLDIFDYIEKEEKDAKFKEAVAINKKEIIKGLSVLIKNYSTMCTENKDYICITK